MLHKKSIIKKIKIFIFYINIFKNVKLKVIYND